MKKSAAAATAAASSSPTSAAPSSTAKKPAAAQPKKPAAAAKSAASSSSSAAAGGTAAKVPAHLTSLPGDNALARRAPNNPHISSAMEAVYKAQASVRERRMGAQRPPRTPASEGDGYVDLLSDEYDHIEGQNYVVTSFLAPEHAVRRREEWLYEQFINWNEFSTGFKVCADFADFVAAKYELDGEAVQKDFDDFMETEKARLRDADVSTKFALFCKNNHAGLMEEYHKLNGRETSVRATLVLGVTSTKEEARALVAEAVSSHENHLDIHVGPVGQWLLWNPDGLVKREYLDAEVNELMAGREATAARQKTAFERRKAAQIETAAEKNRANVAKYGGKTTMEVGPDGRAINTTRRGGADGAADDDDVNENLLAALDGNDVGTILQDGELSLPELMARARLAGGESQRNFRPIDATTGLESDGVDVVRQRALETIAAAQAAAEAQAAAAARAAAEAAAAAAAEETNEDTMPELEEVFPERAEQ